MRGGIRGTRETNSQGIWTLENQYAELISGTWRTEPPLVTVVSASNVSSSSPSSEQPINAFDGNIGTKWFVYGGGTVGIRFTLSKAAAIVKLGFTTANDTPARDPVAYAFSGSTDNSTWISISSGSLSPPAGGARFTPYPDVSFSNSTAYLYYRITFPGSGDCQLSEIRPYGW